MANIVPQFGSLALTGIRQWREVLGQRLNSSIVPFRHGSTGITTPKITPKTIVLSGRMFAASGSALRTSYDSLKNALAYNGQDKLWLWDDRYVNALFNSISPPYIKYDLSAIEFEIDFLCLDPFYYSSSENSQSVGMVSPPANQTYTNAGNAISYPTITITASGGAIPSGLRLTNNHADISTWFQYNAIIASTKVLVIDTYNLNATNDGTTDLGSFSGNFWGLAPGDNVISFTDPGVSFTLQFQWYDRWY